MERGNASWTATLSAPTDKVVFLRRLLRNPEYLAETVVILHTRYVYSVIPSIFFILLLAGCASSQCDVKRGSFEISSLVKTDVDLVTETHQRVVFAALKELAVKLYKRNPREWKKASYISLDDAVAALSSEPFPSVNGKNSIACLRLAFDEEYYGDRV